MTCASSPYECPNVCDGTITCPRDDSQCHGAQGMLGKITSLKTGAKMLLLWRGAGICHNNNEDMCREYLCKWDSLLEEAESACEDDNLGSDIVQQEHDEFESTLLAWIAMQEGDPPSLSCTPEDEEWVAPPWGGGC